MLKFKIKIGMLVGIIVSSFLTASGFFDISHDEFVGHMKLILIMSLIAFLFTIDN